MENIEQQIIATLEKIRPFLMKDGGDVQFVKFDNGIVYIKMLGACSDCISQDATINEGIQIILQEEVPGVLDVRLASEKIHTIEDELKEIDRLLKEENKSE